MKKFPVDMHGKLKHYVYKLVDPRDGSIFYVGKGQGNRVFDHFQGALKHEDDPEDEQFGGSVKRILRIRTVGLEPIHVIHRHGMSEDEAMHVEAALIDSIPGLENAVAGHGSNDYGPANASQLIERYAADELEIDARDRVMLIKIKASTVEDRGSLYEAVRRRWKVDVVRASRAEYVLAIVDGVCRGVFVPHKWSDTDEPGRFGFDGIEANKEISNKYVGRRLPDRMRKKGMATPFLYENL